MKIHQLHTVKLIQWIGYCIVLCSCLSVYAQKQTGAIIPDDAKRKIIKARKLLNQQKIYQGEKILKDLVKDHPNEAYYHEALVQVQRQILARIHEAQQILSQNEYFREEQDSTAKTVDSLNQMNGGNKHAIAQLSDFGLDRQSHGIISKTRKKNEVQNEDTPLQEATVSIDSSLIKEDDIQESPDAAGGFAIQRSLSKEEKSRLKILKKIEDLGEISYDVYLHDFIQNCRYATRVLYTVDSASLYLRTFLIDSIDTDLFAPQEAYEAYTEGLEEMFAKNIPLATKKFETAIEKYPPFYHAWLRLGDCYVVMNQDSAALRSYHYATEINPNLPDAFEKLAQYFYNTGKYTDAATQIIEAILIYPQHQYFNFLQRIVQKKGIIFSYYQEPRLVYPLTTQQNFEEIMAKEKTPWWHYQSAKQDVYSYYDTAGFVRPNEKTNIPYLEMYAWKKMLNNSGKQYFAFARAMDKIGMLDCYVFINLFHYDIYQQFKDFVFKNPDKVRQYFYILINFQDKKYDKLRKEFNIPSL